MMLLVTALESRKTGCEKTRLAVRHKERRCNIVDTSALYKRSNDHPQLSQLGKHKLDRAQSSKKIT